MSEPPPTVRDLSEVVGWLYVTDGTLPNPYNTVSPFLSQMASELARPQTAEWIALYRSGGAPLPLVNASVWLESIFLPGVTDTQAGLGMSSLMLNLIPNDGSGLLYQNVLKFAPNQVLWVPQVVYGDKALHYFPEQFQALAAPSFGQWLIEFGYNDGILSVKGTNIDNGQTIFENAHSLPGNYVRDPAEGKTYPNAPIANAYLAAGGYGGASVATYQPGTILKAEYTSSTDVTDLAFAMWNGETPPGGMNAIGEGSNLYCAFPYQIAPDQISFLMETVPPDMAPTW